MDIVVRAVENVVNVAFPIGFPGFLDHILFDVGIKDPLTETLDLNVKLHPPPPEQIPWCSGLVRETAPVLPARQFL